MSGMYGNRNGFFRISAILLLSIVMVSFFGCASTPTVNPKLVQQYQSPVSVGEDETLIYFIRQNTILGAAQHLWVGCNDKYVANLGAGQYSYIKTPAGLNTITLRQMQIPMYFYRVDFRPSETVFLYFEYTKGAFYEVEPDLGKSIVMSFKKAEKFDGSEINTDYEMGLMNPGLVGLDLMKKDDRELQTDDEHALVSFIREKTLIEAVAFGIWNQDGFLGELKGKSAFTVKLPPGNHTFIANSRYYTALKADLEAGKHYYVRLSISRGWAQANLSLSPVKSSVAESEIEKWKSQCGQVSLDESSIDDKIRKRIDAALPIVEKAIDRVESGDLEFEILEKDDGRIS